VIDRQEFSAVGKPMQKERWAAAIDTAGSHTLANLCAQMQYGAPVAACGLAQGLAFGANLPTAPVITLLAMAERARLAGAGNDLLAVLDARMGEVYWAQYRFNGGWQEVIAPRLSHASQVSPEGSPTLCGNGLIHYGDDLTHLNHSQSLPEIMPHAEEIARLGADLFLAGQSVHARDAQPVYLRNKVALTTLERQAGVRG
jgi:tRNA threonylcarbamoyladenosine biosynthesis protein TsaB